MEALPLASSTGDFFAEKDGMRFAGTHLLLEFWGSDKLDDLEAIESALIEAADKARATILHTHLHRFTPYGGVTGVLVLAESHISIHTWPECQFAAIDIFMCGTCNPYDAVPTLKDKLSPSRFHVCEFRRGILSPED